ncbi:hypothetical protein [Mammaliicoccus vitulinus]|uniref:hypothetical protein n=1 Tax=Mammaliicoccus vitulinus TaxID=71237 RepID=UPI00248AAB00|nr:hypothetical protein [Mammaliicoccus vitulinus]
MLNAGLKSLLKEAKLTKEDLKEILLDNFVNEEGGLDLRYLDFSDFDGYVDISYMKVNNDLMQDSQHVKGTLWQGCQVVEGNLYQSCQKVGGDLDQHEQIVQGDLKQNWQHVQGNLYQQYQCREFIGGNLYSCESILKGKK